MQIYRPLVLEEFVMQQVQRVLVTVAVTALLVLGATPAQAADIDVNALGVQLPHISTLFLPFL